MTTMNDPVQGEGGVIVTEDNKVLLLEDDRDIVDSPKFLDAHDIYHSFGGTDDRKVEIEIGYLWQDDKYPFDKEHYGFEDYAVGPSHDEDAGWFTIKGEKGSPLKFENLTDKLIRANAQSRGFVDGNFNFNFSDDTGRKLGLEYDRRVRIRDAAGKRHISEGIAVANEELIASWDADAAIGATLSNEWGLVFMRNDREKLLPWPFHKISSFEYRSIPDAWEAWFTSVTVRINLEDLPGRKWALFSHKKPLSTNDVGKWVRIFNPPEQPLPAGKGWQVIARIRKGIQIPDWQSFEREDRIGRDGRLPGILKIGWAVYDPTDYDDAPGETPDWWGMPLADTGIAFSDFDAFSGVFLTPNHPSYDNPSEMDPPDQPIE